MYTSSYDRYKGENAVSIAGRCPTWYSGPEYKILAPKLWFFKQYKEALEEIELQSGRLHSIQIKERKLRAQMEYTIHYEKLVLGELDPNKVLNDLGRDAVLLCWEPPGEFCHRRLVAEWLERKLGIQVPELTNEELAIMRGIVKK